MNSNSPIDEPETLDAASAGVNVSPAPPSDVPGYELRDFVGKGAYGQVWTAVDRNTGRRVAIKFFAHRKGVDSSLLSSEVEKLVFLSSDRYVVQLLEVGWDAEPPYYVMEYIENGSLNDRLREGGPIPVNEAVDLFREIAIGLSHAHSKGVLHCDLKPANVLLDQDGRPRLADFGQSRLSGEQSPALGTLFYMAPEQADLGAVPDASWDVYALGSLMHCMLTGSAAYRTNEALSKIESAEELSDQLERYAQCLKSMPPPDEHRRLPDVDRALADIVNQCVALDPDDRYPNVFAVLQALDRRERTRSRRPLWILGLLGPLLLLATVSLFGYRSYQKAKVEATNLAIDGVTARNDYFARLSARNVANEVDRRRRAVLTAARNPKLLSHLNQLMASEGIAEQLARELTPSVKRDNPDVEPDLTTTLYSPFKTTAEYLAFISHTSRQPVQEFIESLLDGETGALIDAPPAASWFLTDQRGTHLAAAFQGAKPSKLPIGENYAWRTYFHGEPLDFQDRTHMPEGPIGDVHLSAVFRSTATFKWKVAISAPVIGKDGQTIGVIAMTVELGEFIEKSEEGKNQFAVVVDGREGQNRGVILQHPLYDHIHEEDPDQEIPDHTGQEYRIDLEEFVERQQNTTAPLHYTDYVDPISHDATYGQDFAGTWVASAAPVNIERKQSGTPDKKKIQTGLWVVVQERINAVTEPVDSLARRMLSEAIAALAAIVALSIALWWLVRNMMKESLRPSSGQFVGANESTIHSRETLEQPQRASKSR